ncbi:MAG TPA: hypothetical protein VIW94_03785 [Acidimicrobiia bacterium]
MLIQHEVAVNLPIGSLEAVVLDRFADAESLGTPVYRKGEELRSKIGLDGPIAKEVVLSLGHPKITNSGLAIPVTWRATGAGLLFPRLTGEIEISRGSVDKSRMRIQASYDPPFGWIGDVLDRLLLERIAQITVADWLERVAASLESAPRSELVVHNRDGDLDDRADPDH